MPRIRARAALVAAIAVGFAAAPTTIEAQAFLPAKGEGTVAVLFSSVVSNDHFLPDERVQLGRIDSHTFLVDITYGISDRVAVSAGLPLVVSRYRGERGHRPITLDDEAWHTAAQDVRFSVRYNASRGPVVLTPFVGAIVPSHDYEFYAHAAPGRRLREVLAGISVARLFADLGLVVQGRYAYGVAERVVQIVPQHSEGAIEVGYFVTPAVRVFAQGSGRVGHTGIDLTPQSSQLLPFDVFRHHDRIAREHALHVSAGTAVSITESLDLFASYMTTVAGRNTHAVNRGLSFGLAWSFRRSGGSITRASRSVLARCLCEKTGG